MNYIVTYYKGETDFDEIVTLAKIASIALITNVFPGRGASAIKRIKSRQRSITKNDLLNALIHISLNDPQSIVQKRIIFSIKMT